MVFLPADKPPSRGMWCLRHAGALAWRRGPERAWRTRVMCAAGDADRICTRIHALINC